MIKFIEGIIFVLIVLPLLEGIVSIFNQGVEYVCTRIAFHTFSLQKKMQNGDIPEQTTIGFDISDDEIEEYEDD